MSRSSLSGRYTNLDILSRWESVSNYGWLIGHTKTQLLGQSTDLPRKSLRRFAKGRFTSIRSRGSLAEKMVRSFPTCPGRGDKVLEYLARYIFRIAIANSRIESIDDGNVRFRYRDNRTQQIRRITLSGVEFIPSIRSTYPSRAEQPGSATTVSSAP
jgi:hypothetical protein